MSIDRPVSGDVLKFSLEASGSWLTTAWCSRAMAAMRGRY
jgi:hypothetical protein